MAYNAFSEHIRATGCVMDKRLSGLAVSCLILALTGAASAARVEDDPAWQALQAAREMSVRVSADSEAPPEAYLPVLQRYREIVEQYPESPCAADALESIAALYAWRLSRPEEAVAAWEQVIERYPGTSEAWNALNCLRNTIEVVLKSPDRWHTELRRMTDVLKRWLPSQTNEKERCGVLSALVLAADQAGDTGQAIAYCEELLAGGEHDPESRRRASEYIEHAKAWPLVRLTETATVMYTTPGDSLTPDIEVEQRLSRCLSVAAKAPRGQQFRYLLTLVGAAPPHEAKPKGLIRTLPDGRTTVTWEGKLEGEGLLAGCLSGHGPQVVWKSEAHFDGVKVWREARMLRPGRQLVTVIVEAEWPVRVEITCSKDAPIDANSVNPRPETLATGHVTRRQAAWQFERGSVFPESGTMGNLDARRGRVFTLEMDLLPRLKCVMPRVTVNWSRNDWAVGPDAPPSQAQATTRYNGAVADLPYILESATPFRVTSRWVITDVTCHLWERTERK